jgi:hypothetical protein
VPSSAPATSPRLRRRPSPWPPGRRRITGRGVPRLEGRVRAALQPLSTRFELADHRLRGVMPLVPRVHLPVLLAEPAPSGSPSASRRCRGCLPPSPASPGSGCPSFLMPLRRHQGKGLSPPLGSMAPRGAPHQRPTRRWRPATSRRPGPPRPPGPGWPPAGGGGHGQLAGQGRCQAGKQVRGFAVVEGVGVGEWGQGGWDRG